MHTTQPDLRTDLFLNQLNMHYAWHWVAKLWGFIFWWKWFQYKSYTTVAFFMKFEIRDWLVSIQCVTFISSLRSLYFKGLSHVHIAHCKTALFQSNLYLHIPCFTLYIMFLFLCYGNTTCKPRFCILLVSYRWKVSLWMDDEFLMEQMMYSKIVT